MEELCYGSSCEFSQEHSGDVLEFSAEEEVWNKIGEMTMKRAQGHAVSVINYNAIKDYCN